jgi:diguanylate cyclase (GGDEF)-like protein/PAS domain S-box-containing protein
MTPFCQESGRGDDILDMAYTRFDAELADTAFRVLLAQNAEARVVPLNADGLIGEMPDSLEVNPEHVLRTVGALGLVVPDDRVVVIEAWETMLDRGTSRVEVHLANDPDSIVTLYHFDLRYLHNTFVSVLVPLRDHAEDDLFRPTAPAPARPMLANVEKDGQAKILGIDEGTTLMLGWTADEMLGHRTLDFIHPDDHEMAINSWMEMLGRPGMAYGARVRHRHRDGSWVWVQIINHNTLREENGVVVSQLIDISEEMAAVEALRARERLLDRLAEALPVGLFQIDLARHINYSNERLTQILGQDPRTVQALKSAIVAEDRVMLDAAIEAVMSKGVDLDVEVHFERGHGEGVRVGTVMLRALTDDHGAVIGAVASLADVTDSASMRVELEKRATYDELTGCHNRASILTELNTALSSQAAGAGTAVVFVDLDAFKPINDELGHAAGDELLMVVADRLQSQTRDLDTVGRIGGDEFLIVCPRVGNSDEALLIAERVASSVSGEIALNGRFVEPQVSVGVAWTDSPVEADTLIAHADTAMYESKRVGRGEPVYSPVQCLT